MNKNIKMKRKNIIIGLILLLTLSCSDNESTNLPPEKPIPWGSASSTCEVLRPTLSWRCSDADDDDLMYTLKFGESATNLTEIATNLKTTEFTFSEELEKSKKYYWQVIASDGKDETTGDVWDFSTVGNPIISVVPSTPIIISPKMNTSAGNVEFTWSVVVDDKGMENITFILNINGEETEVVGASTKELTVGAGECTWFVTAYDEDGNGAESEYIKIVFE